MAVLTGEGGRAGPLSQHGAPSLALQPPRPPRSSVSASQDPGARRELWCGGGPSGGRDWKGGRPWGRQECRWEGCGGPRPARSMAEPRPGARPQTPALEGCTQAGCQQLPTPTHIPASFGG